MKFATVIILMDIFIKVEGWSCASSVRKVYSQINTDAVLPFSADLSNLNSPRQFFVNLYDNTLQGWIRYEADRSYSTDTLSGVRIIGNTTGKVIVTLENVQQKSAGIYTFGSAGFTVKCICLYILGKPTKPKITLNNVPFVGDRSTITCSSTSTTTPSNHSLSLTYNWRVDNVGNPSGSRFLYSSNTLTLLTIVKDDAYKRITCTAKEAVANGCTSISSNSFSFDVHYGPDTANITVKSPYYITEGETNVRIECFSDCYPGCSYTWTNLTSDSRISMNGTLFLDTVNRYMAGDYKCTSSNTAIQYKSSETNISTIVNYAPDVIMRLSKNNTREGGNLTLFCDGVGVPSTYRYISLSQTWNNTEIPNSNTAVSGKPKYSSIHFSPLTFQDTGTYTCILTNEIRNIFGALNQASSVNILVEVRPKVLTDELRFPSSTGGTANVYISFYSYPSLDTLTVTRHDDTPVSSGKYKIFKQMVETAFYGKSVLLNGSTLDLVVKNLKENDFGNYTLKLTNRIGTTNVVVSIIAEGRPSPPKDFGYLPGYNIPTFVWEKNFNGGKKQNFVIQTSKAGSELWTNHTNISENDKQYQINSTFYMANIHGLQPGTYSAGIFSHNAMGESETVGLGYSFVVERQTDGPSNSMPIAAIAGGIATTAVVIVIVVVVLVVLKRRVRNKDDSQKKLNTRNCGTVEEDDDDESEVNTVNPMYAPADQSIDNTYAQPIKKKKTSEVNDVYAVVDQKTKKDRKEKHFSKNASQKTRKTNTSKSENAHDENVYENPETVAAKQSKKLANKDGLIYADLAFNDQAKGQKNQVIVGLDSMTEYVEVDFTKKAEPLPDSDEEKNKSL